MTTPKEMPHLLGTAHIYKDASGTICGQVIKGLANGNYSTDRANFIRRVSNDYPQRMFIHCHLCEAMLTIWDVINSYDV